MVWNTLSEVSNLDWERAIDLFYSFGRSSVCMWNIEEKRTEKTNTRLYPLLFIQFQQLLSLLKVRFHNSLL